MGYTFYGWDHGISLTDANPHFGDSNKSGIRTAPNAAAESPREILFVAISDFNSDKTAIGVSSAIVPRVCRACHVHACTTHRV